MSLKMRIYYNAVCGALGGLIAWALSGLVLGGTASSFFMLLVRDAALGAIVGVSIGALLGAVDGVMARSARLAARGAWVGGLLGLFGGMIGLVTGELIFSYAGGGVWARAAGWAIFGALVGASEGIATRAPLKLTYGAIGGILGGLVGGSAYERTSDVLRATTQNRDLALTVGGAVGLVILGACLGALIALTLVVVRDAWFRFMGGRLEGREVLVGKRVLTVGASDACDVYVPGDSAVASTHASVERRKDGYVFTVDPAASPVVVDHHAVAPGASVVLHGGEHLRIGSTPLIFRLDGMEEA